METGLSFFVLQLHVLCEVVLARDKLQRSVPAPQKKLSCTPAVVPWRQFVPEPRKLDSHSRTVMNSNHIYSCLPPKKERKIDIYIYTIVEGKRNTSSVPCEKEEWCIVSFELCRL